MLNIPQTLLHKARIANKMNEQEFNEYLETLKKQGRVYIKSFFIDDEVEEEVMDLCIELYVEYALFSKIEYEEVSQDKLSSLHMIINNHNRKVEEAREQERRKNSFKKNRVKFI